MKHLAIVGLVVLTSAWLFLSACDSNSDCEELEAEIAALAQENANHQAKIDPTSAPQNSEEPDVSSMGDELDSSKAECDSLLSDYEAIIGELTSLRADYQSLLDGTEGSTLRDPDWEDLKRFLLQDNTDSNTYVADGFDCEGFTIGLRDSAWRQGFRCAFVAIGFRESTTGHALNAFQTVDKGMVYVDNTEHDSIGYLEIGKVYGTIALDGVKGKYINCDMQPDEFWKPITYTHSTGSIFTYGYYQDYIQRGKFHRDSIDAYNDDVAEYNAAAIAFNKGSSKYSHSQLDNWSEKLENWSSNLNALADDLGSVRLEPMDVVDSIETYWN